MPLFFGDGIEPSCHRGGPLKFDLSAVSTVSSAKLQLFGSLNDTQNSNVLVNVFNSSGPWTETGITYKNKPGTSPTLRGSTTISGTTDQWHEIDLTSFLKSEKTAGRNTVTLVLKAGNTTDPQAIFHSDETTNGPRLLVNA